MLPSSLFHIGGDEVQCQCWESSPKMTAYLAKRNMTGVELYQVRLSSSTRCAASSSPFCFLAAAS